MKISFLSSLCRLIEFVDWRLYRNANGNKRISSRLASESDIDYVAEVWPLTNASLIINFRVTNNKKLKNCFAGREFFIKLQGFESPKIINALYLCVCNNNNDKILCFFLCIFLIVSLNRIRTVKMK